MTVVCLEIIGNQEGLMFTCKCSYVYLAALVTLLAENDPGFVDTIGNDIELKIGFALYLLNRMPNTSQLKWMMRIRIE